MNSNRNHLKTGCLASVMVLLAACSNSGDIKPDTAATVAKTTPKPMTVAAAAPAPVASTGSTQPKPVPAKPVVAKAAVAKKAVVAQAAKPKPVYRAPVKKVVAARPVAKTVAKPAVKPVTKQYRAPKPYVPPKPIVVAVHKAPAKPAPVVSRPVAKPAVRRVAAKPVVAKAPVVNTALRRPGAPVAAKNTYRAPVPQIRPAAVPRATANRSVYVAPKPAARVQQASYRPAPAPRAVARPAVQRAVSNPGGYSQSRLTGDFAGNAQAQAFANMMVSRHGFDRNYVYGVLSQAKATSWLRKMAYQDANPKRRTSKGEPSWSRYRSRFLTSKHINDGTAFYNKYRGSLERAASQYGVPSEYILGIMGVETIYGGNVGTDRALDALATMGFMNSRRGKYFQSELEAYLLMTRRTGLNPTQPKASYAGALGLPQFMPSNIKKYGVDYDGDGAVNLWTPHDAIGSIANYLNKHGWKRGEIAAIPAKRTGGSGYSNLSWGFKHKYTLSTLSRKGLAPVYPGVSGNVHMLKLKTNNGYDYWIGGNNFYAITRYNHSSFYAMAVHQLAQEIRKRVKPGRELPRVIEASADRDLLIRAASSLL